MATWLAKFLQISADTESAAGDFWFVWYPCRKDCPVFCRVLMSFFSWLVQALEKGWFHCHFQMREAIIYILF